MMSTVAVSQTEFQKLTHYIEEECGIVIPEHKQYLLESRLVPVLVEEECNTYLELYKKISTTEASRKKVIDAITTNETLWFRDNKPFNFLETVHFPAIIEKLKKGEKSSFNILSVACSTGQEPYSLAMLLQEVAEKYNAKEALKNVKIEAFDICSTAIQYAKHGKYTQLALKRGMTDHFQNKYFEEEKGAWVIKDGIKSMVSFFEFNMKDLSSLRTKYDLILCRNVLIYFSKPFKQKTIDTLENKLNSDALFFLGASESMIGIDNSLEKQMSNNFIYYQKRS